MLSDVCPSVLDISASSCEVSDMAARSGGGVAQLRDGCTVTHIIHSLIVQVVFSMYPGYPGIRKVNKVAPTP